MSPGKRVTLNSDWAPAGCSCVSAQAIHSPKRLQDIAERSRTPCAAAQQLSPPGVLNELPDVADGKQLVLPRGARCVALDRLSLRPLNEVAVNREMV